MHDVNDEAGTVGWVPTGPTLTEDIANGAYQR